MYEYQILKLVLDYKDVYIFFVISKYIYLTKTNQIELIMNVMKSRVADCLKGLNWAQEN